MSSKLTRKIATALSIDDVRIEVLGESRAFTCAASQILKYLPKARTLVELCRELDEELDGVKIPASAAAIVNAIRSIVEEIDEE